MNLFKMTTSAELAAQLAQVLESLQIRENFENIYTLSSVYERNKLSIMFSRTFHLLTEYLSAFPEEKLRSKHQNAVYIEFASLQRLLIAYPSFVNDTDMMRFWVRMFSCLPIVRQSMTENGHTLGVFGGVQTWKHKFRKTMPWQNQFVAVISSINLRIIASAKFACILPGLNTSVEMLILNARFELIMQDGPTKTLLDRIVDVFAQYAAKEHKSQLPSAGTKSCPGA